MVSADSSATATVKKHSTKARLTDSPLARPDRLIHQLAAEIQNYLYFPDPSPLYVTLGTIAANMIHGNPVWLILVGPPGCGKTEILEMTELMPDTKIVSVIKGESALLSGSGKRDISKGATGGLLREIGNHGMLVMTDMAGMLKLNALHLGEVLAAFRDIYGGRWVRPVGTDGGRSLVWGPLKPGDKPGKLTFLAGSTNVIDRHHQINAELGERWVYYRFPDSDGHGETQSAQRNKNPQESRQIMRQHVVNFFSALGLSLKEPVDKRDFTAREELRLESMAQLSVRVRSDVPRDLYTKEVIDIVEPERPQRLATVLGQLYLGLEIIGLPETERWKLVGKVAMDSSPRVRAEVVKAAWHCYLHDETLSLVDLKLFLKCGHKATSLVVDDLEVHGVVETYKLRAGRTVGGDQKGIRLTEWARDMMRIGWHDE